MKHRHRARRLVLQALCCLDAQGNDAMDLAVSFLRDSRTGLDVQTLAEQMLAAAWAHTERADVVLRRRSQHWDISRMPVVDRNILRLAVWELAVEHAPVKVVIDEAVRLAKEFSTADSPRFVNGVLDAIAKAPAEDESAQP